MNRVLFAIVVLLLFVSADRMAIARTAADDEQPELCVGMYLTESQGRAQLHRFRKSFPTMIEWNRRAAATRSQILRGCGLDPLPRRTPLRAIVRYPRIHDGYLVESVAFEAIPGFLVFGSLYRPYPPPARPVPAVLCPHGHHREPNGGARFHPFTQQRAVTLARMGAICLSYDMLGFGESGLRGWTHESSQALPLQLWSSIRALDYLTSRPDIDPRRLAVTGESGGGSQSFLLTAVDPRIRVVVPVVMVASHFFGGCVCESGHPIHKTRRHVTNNADIAACAAPRPQLLISVGSDWTRNTPQVEYPYLRDVYRRFGCPHRVANVHFPTQDHDYGPAKQFAMYSFLAHHLGLDAEQVDLGRVTIESWDRMLNFDELHPTPPHAMPPNTPVTWPR